MSEHSMNDVPSADDHLESGHRPVKRRGKKTARASESNSRPGLIQVSAQVPREIIASFDRQAGIAGVNRQHLIREALTMYAALLDAGGRFYQVPGQERSRERAA